MATTHNGSTEHGKIARDAKGALERMTTENRSGAAAMARRPDRLILVYDGDSGLRALLADVLKKLVGREECALCEITYSATGKRRAWAACEKRLGLIVDELHRDQLPEAWGISRAHLPCVLARNGEDRPFVLLTREDIARCQGSVERLDGRIAEALDSAQGSAEVQPPAGVRAREP